MHSSTPFAAAASRRLLDFCVPFFFVTAVTFFAKGLSARTSLGPALAKIWKRIGIPFVAWSFLYAGLILTKNQLSHKASSFNAIPIFLYGSSAEHLYYLPQLAMMQAIGLSSYSLAAQRQATAALAVLLAALFYLWWGTAHRYFGMTSAPHLITYLIAGFYLASRLNQIKINWWFIAVGGVLVVLILIGIGSGGETYTGALPFLLRNLPLGGVGLLLLSLGAAALRFPKATAVVFSATYGIYLSHVLFLEAFEFLDERILHSSIVYTFSTKLLISLVIFIISLAFTLTIRRFAALRTVFLGEN